MENYVQWLLSEEEKMEVKRKKKAGRGRPTSHNSELHITFLMWSFT
jgi:hypothetical protein